MIDDALLRQLSDEFLRRYPQDKPAACLIGSTPDLDLGYRYVGADSAYEAVVIGSLSAADLLCFSSEPVVRALLQGLPVYLVERGLEHRQYARCANRLLWNRLLAAERQLQQLGIQFVGGRERQRLITASDARQLQKLGQAAPAGCRLTPLAREILEGKA